MACKTCKRALLPEGADEDGNCPDCSTRSSEPDLPQADDEQ